MIGRIFVLFCFIVLVSPFAIAAPKIPNSLPKDVKNRISISDFETTDEGYRVLTVYREGKMLAKTSVYRPGFTVSSDVLMYVGYMTVSQDALDKGSPYITVIQTSYRSNREENGARYFSKDSTRSERRRLHKKDFQFQIVYKLCDCPPEVSKSKSNDMSAEPSIASSQVAKVVDAARLLKDAEFGLQNMEDYFSERPQ